MRLRFSVLQLNPLLSCFVQLHVAQLLMQAASQLAFITLRSTAQHQRGKRHEESDCMMQAQGRGQSAPLASWTSMVLKASRRTALSSCASTWPMSGCSSSSTSMCSRGSRSALLASRPSTSRTRFLPFCFFYLQKGKGILLENKWPLSANEKAMHHTPRAMLLRFSLDRTLGVATVASSHASVLTST